MIAHRVLPWDPAVRPEQRGGPLWFPRELQGSGRHDNPELYGCLYLAEQPVSAIAERLAPFRGSGALDPSMLVQGGRGLALATLDLGEGAEIVDLDDPRVLASESLRPSRVATGNRARTRADAARLYRAHPGASGLRWWSTLESSWANLTIFDRARPLLKLSDVRQLTVDDTEVRAAAEALGLF